MIGQVLRRPGFTALVFWAISLAIFLLNGGDSLGSGQTLPFDSGWYANIARNGYQFDGDYTVQQNIAFFPLYPIFVALIHYVMQVPIGYAELITSAAMTLAACLLFHRVALHVFGEQVANMSIGLWVANPFAIYLFNGYSEAALVLAIAAFCYFLVVRPRMHWAALSVIAASLARPYGIFLALIFFVYVLHAWRWGREREWLRVLLIHVPLSLTGYLFWCLYSELRFGDPLAPLHSTSAWTGAVMPLFQVVSLEAPLEAIHETVTGDVLLDPVALGSFFFLGGLLLFVAYARRFPLALALYGLVLPILLFPVIVQRGALVNSGRYETPYFIHFVALALLVHAFDKRLVQDVQATPQTSRAMPLAFYPVYLLFLSGFIRYTHYYFDKIWVS